MPLDRLASFGEENFGKNGGMSWSPSIAVQVAQGCKGVLGHHRTLGPSRDGQTHHLLEENFSATSPPLCLRVLWTTHQDRSLSSFTPTRENLYFRSRFFWYIAWIVPSGIHQGTGFLEARWGWKICLLIKLEGGFNWIQ